MANRFVYAEKSFTAF